MWQKWTIHKTYCPNTYTDKSSRTCQLIWQNTYKIHRKNIILKSAIISNFDHEKCLRIKFKRLLLRTSGCAAMLGWVGMIGLPPIRAVAEACCVGVLGVVCPLLTDRAFALVVEVTVAETWACNGVNVIPEFWKKKPPKICKNHDFTTCIETNYVQTSLKTCTYYQTLSS